MSDIEKLNMTSDEYKASILSIEWEDRKQTIAMAEIADNIRIVASMMAKMLSKPYGVEEK